MRTAYKCRGYPTPEQADVLNRTFGCVRVVWNRTLAWHQRWYGEKVPTNVPEANAYLTAMERTEKLAFLNEVSSVPLQVLRTQQKAFANFYAKRGRSPRFKSRNGRQSAEYTRSGFRYRDGRLRLAKMDAALHAGGLTPVGFHWISRTMHVPVSVIRDDRILPEVASTDGDLRRICGLFDLTVEAALRYLPNPELSQLEDESALQPGPVSV